MKEYEHRILTLAPCVIWVRRKMEAPNHLKWNVYLVCDSAEDAQHKLKLLRHPAGLEMVMP